MFAAILVKNAVRVFVVEDSALIRRRIIDNVQSMGGFDVVGFAERQGASGFFECDRVFQEAVAAGRLYEAGALRTGSVTAAK